ncbi:MAG: hypothetical protein JWN82_570 [Candidatus Saccharibacteria bacterium]|nr:hypothetical protein [Candidatus Saccharibacteria bacterium]
MSHVYHSITRAFLLHFVYEPYALDFDVFTSVGKLQAVAIRTKYPQIVDSVIKMITVYMIQLNWNSTIFAHFSPAAELTFCRLKPLFIQPSLQFVALHPTAIYQKLLDGWPYFCKVGYALVPS